MGRSPTGTLIKKHGSWSARFFAIDPGTGERKRITRRLGTSNREEAAALLKEMVDASSMRTLNDQTLAQFLVREIGKRPVGASFSELVASANEYFGKGSITESEAVRVIPRVCASTNSKLYIIP